MCSSRLRESSESDVKNLSVFFPHNLVSLRLCQLVSAWRLKAS